MSDNLITQMIEAGSIDHGHYVFGKIHTDNSVKADFLYNYKLADTINLLLYKQVNDVAAENIVAIDPVATLMAYPISLMCKRNLFSPGNIEGAEIDGGSIIIVSTVYDLFDINQVIKLKDLSPKSIVCVTNYSGHDTFEGIPIQELVPVNTWVAEDCPYCKEEA